jgi:hypothetical protein
MRPPDRIGLKRGTLHPVGAGFLGGIMAMDLAVFLAVFSGLSVSGMARIIGYEAGSDPFWLAAFLGAFLGWTTGMVWGAHLARLMAIRSPWMAGGIAFTFGVGILIGFGGLLWIFRHI